MFVYSFILLYCMHIYISITMEALVIKPTPLICFQQLLVNIILFSISAFQEYYAMKFTVPYGIHTAKQLHSPPYFCMHQEFSLLYFLIFNHADVLGFVIIQFCYTHFTFQWKRLRSTVLGHMVKFYSFKTKIYFCVFMIVNKSGNILYFNVQT